jgi:hypothetical protein
MLTKATISAVPRDKALVVPEYDQFSPPAAVAEEVVGWRPPTTVTTAPGADHFLRVVEPVVEAALDWIRQLGAR